MKKMQFLYTFFVKCLQKTIKKVIFAIRLRDNRRLYPIRKWVKQFLNQIQYETVNFIENLEGQNKVGNFTLTFGWGESPSHLGIDMQI